MKTLNDRIEEIIKDVVITTSMDNSFIPYVEISKDDFKQKLRQLGEESVKAVEVPEFKDRDKKTDQRFILGYDVAKELQEKRK